ncbi:hypothetical protein DVH24_016817 [Malus domestica]|uniref:Uncharacterized protein n=1 Tax=Malus domestica TaxID=3750 RepID=A0A498HWP3_MALDO|nr:hypothetical protein DVH24_016817 [Malus domestica]
MGSLGVLSREPQIRSDSQDLPREKTSFILRERELSPSFPACLAPSSSSSSPSSLRLACLHLHLARPYLLFLPDPARPAPPPSSQATSQEHSNQIAPPPPLFDPSQSNPLSLSLTLTLLFVLQPHYPEEAERMQALGPT